MTTGSHELALTIINDGAGYKKRCQIARDVLKRNTFGATSYAAYRWFNVASAGAGAYERQFGSPNASCFTVEDILLAAVELAEYYATHISEIAA